MERKGDVEVVERTSESSSVANQEGSSVGQKSYQRESQASGGDTRSPISRPPQRRAHAAWHANPRGEAVRGDLHWVPGPSFSNWRRTELWVHARIKRRESTVRVHTNVKNNVSDVVKLFIPVISPK